MELKDQVVVITGASRGIGRAISLAFAREGATVVAAARREHGGLGSLEETVERILEQGGRAIPVRCDLTVPEDVKGLVDRTLRELGRIDVLINNAGVSTWKDIGELSIDEWDTVIKVNLSGVFLSLKYALPSMMERRSGNVIYVSAEMAIQPRAIAYAASKAGLNRLSLDLAGDMQEYNIAINVFLPGFVDTEILQDGPGLRMGRVPEPVEAVVPAMLWLAQQRGLAITGQLLKRTEFGRTWGPGSGD